MVIAGEASGDGLAAELIQALRSTPSVQNQIWPPHFFGVGGPRLASQGVHLHCDLTAYAAVGLIEVLKRYRFYKRLFNQLLDLACSELPDLILLVDYSGFNRRFASALRSRLSKTQNSAFHNWRPRIVYFVSPQVWASRPDRALSLARDLDLLLCIFPFEKSWYAARTPSLPVEFIGHPLLDRYPSTTPAASNPSSPTTQSSSAPKLGLLLPGSRAGELKNHLPPMLDAVRIMRPQMQLTWKLVVPSESLLKLAQLSVDASGLPIHVQQGGLAEAFQNAHVAIASTGTVTLELAFFGVPTVALYKTSKLTYEIGRRIIQVRFLAMPNLLANQAVFPELIQDQATAQNIAEATLPLIQDADRRQIIQTQLKAVIQSLGSPGACQRGAERIANLLSSP